MHDTVEEEQGFVRTLNSVCPQTPVLDLSFSDVRSLGRGGGHEWCVNR